jgi:hypothetical protein
LICQAPDKQKKRRTAMMTMYSRISLANITNWACELVLLVFIALLAWLASRGMRLHSSDINLLLTLGFMVCGLTYARRRAREQFILTADLPQSLKRKLRLAYPHLSDADADKAEQGLRDFFIACLHNKQQFMAMPSQAVDVLWHEFILHTKAYEAWCHRALGRFLHHTPAEALGKSAQRNDGLRRIWYWACKRDGINPRWPTHLPYLFAIDNQLSIADGFHYAPDCKMVNNKFEDQKSGGCGAGVGAQVHCGTSFGSASFSGSSDDFGGVENSFGGDGDGGSDGDGGCGGGCGGD